MSRLTQLASFLTLALCAASASYAVERNGDKFNFTTPMTVEVPVEIAADSFSASSNGWVVADGNVLIRHNDSQITADHIRVNKESGDIVAEGNVVLVRRGQGVTRTDRLTYNYKKGEGETPRLDVHSAVFRVIAEKAKRIDDGSYELENVKVTTCTNEEDTLHYYVKARKAYYLPDQYVILKNATFIFEDIPFLYLSSAKKSLVDHFGWRFEPGYETDWGGYLLTTYKRQIADYGGEHYDSLDSFTHIDYRTERGFALGEDIDWHFGDRERGEGHFGTIGVYGIFDDNPMDDDYDREKGTDIPEDFRYKAFVDISSALSDNDNIMVRSSYYSDSYVLPDFYEDEYKLLTHPDSFAAYAHTGEGWSAGLGVYHRANEFYESLNRMPEAWLDILNTQIGNTPFYYESQSEAAFLQKEFADYGVSTNKPAESYDSLRVDSRQALYLPLKFFEFLSFVPRSVYRGTYYGTTREVRRVPHLSGSNTVYRTQFSDGDADYRNLFEFGVETSFKAYGMFEDDAGRLRHIVEPYVNYTFIPEPNIRPSAQIKSDSQKPMYDLYKFDYIDSLDKANNVRFGLRQHLQRKVEEVTVDRIYADIYAIYDIENAKEESGLRTIGFDGEFRPTNSIFLDVDLTYDAMESEVDYADAWLTLWQGDSWEISTEFYYKPDKKDPCTQYSGAIAVNFTEHWGAKIYARYDSERARLEQITGHIQYNLDCISFRLHCRYEPAFTREDGTEREQKIRVSFYTWLRAFPEKRYVRKMHEDIDYMDD